MHIHFVGINGSGISGAACIAAANGYKVSGCDCNKNSNYSAQFQNIGINPMEGHDESHISDDVDLVVITPHFLYQDMYQNIPELVKAKNKGILIKWQEFLGKYIMPNKQTIAICGTHGKTTTTSLVGVALEDAGVDPTVLVGGLVPNWNRTFREGSSDYYVIEADEYDNNFMHYNPKYLVFHTLEMEHPEIFSSFDEYKQNFINFLHTIQENGVLLFNMDCPKICEVVESLRDSFKVKNISLIGYGIENKEFPCDKKYYASDIKFGAKSSFKINEANVSTDLIGLHNIYNLLAGYSICNEVSPNIDFQRAIENFKGAKRRLEVVFENDKVILYNDYAHHHNQVEANLKALKSAYPEHKIIAVFEPHQISRLVDNTDEYMHGLDIADKFYISKIFKGREANKETPNVDAMIASYSHKAMYEQDNQVIVEDILSNISELAEKYIIIVMGAGESYKITELLENKLK